jgi:hypothetical protein
MRMFLCSMLAGFALFSIAACEAPGSPSNGPTPSTASVRPASDVTGETVTFTPAYLAVLGGVRLRWKSTSVAETVTRICSRRPHRMSARFS